MNWNINTIIPAIAFFLYGGLYIIVATSTPQTVIRRSFRWYLATMLIWSFAGFIVLADIGRTLYWFRLMSVSAIGTMVSIFYFTQALLEKKYSWTKYVYIYLIVTSIITSVSNTVIKSVRVENNTVVDYQFGSLTFLGIPAYLLIIFVFVELVKEIRIINDENQRNRLLYLIMGIGVMYLATFLNFTPLGKYPVDIAANIVTAFLIAYAILRYQLLDIRLAIRQGMLYSIPTVIIGAAYFLVITLSLQLVDTLTGVRIFLLSLIVAVIAALVAEPLRIQAQNIIDKMFFREKYDSRLMLQTLSSRVASILDIYEITNMILEEVSSTLHISIAAFFLRDEASGRFTLTTQIGNEGAQSVEFRRGHPLVLWISSHDDPIIRHDIEVLPQFKSITLNEKQNLDDLNAELFIPIKVQDDLVGMFIVGAKRSEQEYSSEDILTLSTVANQTAVAIENARLYTSEQTRLNEMNTLYSMARRLVATDDLDTVVRTVAQHAGESVQVTYTRLITREENGDYFCRAVHPAQGLITNLGLGKKEPLVAEHYYNWILQYDRTVVIGRRDRNLHHEEKQALFLENANSICLSPLKGVDESIGLLILGETSNDHKEIFDTTKLRLINVISDYATSAIQRAMFHTQLEENFLQTVVSLANAIDARDKYTGDHSQRMADMATRVSQAMNLSETEVEAVYWAAILHDIGKIGVPDKILNKPGPLTKKEWAVMKEHPVDGAKIVAPLKILAPVAPLIRAHHERFDGSGYPYGLAGNDIPLGSRILAVIDAYMAIRDERIYSKRHTHKQSIKEIKKFSGTQFDPEVVEVFCRIITE
ncbi:MAG: HD domain-containing protein [Anaerolineales bacterium]|nr:HD domain-containing protein [Anaerolineales bacterium]